VSPSCNTFSKFKNNQPNYPRSPQPLLTLPEHYINCVCYNTWDVWITRHRLSLVVLWRHIPCSTPLKITRCKEREYENMSGQITWTWWETVFNWWMCAERVTHLIQLHNAAFFDDRWKTDIVQIDCAVNRTRMKWYSNNVHTCYIAA
jgi:hypothetical protein